MTKHTEKLKAQATLEKVLARLIERGDPVSVWQLDRFRRAVGAVADGLYGLARTEALNALVSDPSAYGNSISVKSVNPEGITLSDFRNWLDAAKRMPVQDPPAYRVVERP